MQYSGARNSVHPFHLPPPFVLSNQIEVPLFDANGNLQSIQIQQLRTNNNQILGTGYVSLHEPQAQHLYNGNNEPNFATIPKLNNGPTVDANCNGVGSIISLLETGMFESLAKDKIGSQMIQDVLPQMAAFERSAVYEYIAVKGGFDALCLDSYGHFIVQKMVERAQVNEQILLADKIIKRIREICWNIYGCRIIQKAVACFNTEIALRIAYSLRGLVTVASVDQCATHIIQRLVKQFPPTQYEFMVMELASKKSDFRMVIRSKYGCRVVQMVVEVLGKGPCFGISVEYRKQLMKFIIDDSKEYVSHPYANYIVQRVIASGFYPLERDRIIANSILRSILSLSQEKYASHVVEKALTSVSSTLLRAMMDEIFDGYQPESDGRDALDIMLFDQYGNYVVQTMLDVAADVARGIREGNISWFERLSQRIISNQIKLSRYSSGKNILEKLKKILNTLGLIPDGGAAVPSCVEISEG